MAVQVGWRILASQNTERGSIIRLSTSDRLGSKSGHSSGLQLREEAPPCRRDGLRFSLALRTLPKKTWNPKKWLRTAVLLKGSIAGLVLARHRHLRSTCLEQNRQGRRRNSCGVPDAALINAAELLDCRRSSARAWDLGGASASAPEAIQRTAGKGNDCIERRHMQTRLGPVH